MAERYVFGTRVGEALDLRQWTQGQLALFSEVGQSHISQVIANKKKPRIDIAIALADALGVSLDWLAGLPPQPGVDTLEPDARELVEAYSRLDEAHRQVVLLLAQGLAQGLAEKK